MKFSVFSVCLPEYDVPGTVELLKKLGYDGVEWRVCEPPPAEKPADYSFEWRYWSWNRSTVDIATVDREAGHIKALCDAAGLEISALATYLTLWDTADIERVLFAAKTMGCKKIRVDAPDYDEKENYRVQFDRAAKQVREVEKLAAKAGIRVNFETHMGKIIPSASAAYRLVEGCDPRYIGILLDPGNMVYEGFENYKLGLELLGPYLGHVHVKNSCWQSKGTTPDGVEHWEPTWAQFTKGYADLGRLVKLLREAGYDDYISVEDFTNDQDTVTKLAGDLAYLRTL